MNKKFKINLDGICSMDLDKLYTTISVIRKEIEDLELDDNEAEELLLTVKKCKEYVAYEMKYGERPETDYTGMYDSCVNLEHEILSGSKWFLDFLYPFGCAE